MNFKVDACVDRSRRQSMAAPSVWVSLRPRHAVALRRVGCPTSCGRLCAAVRAEAPCVCAHAAMVFTRSFGEDVMSENSAKYNLGNSRSSDNNSNGDSDLYYYISGVPGKFAIPQAITYDM